MLDYTASGRTDIIRAMLVNPLDPEDEQGELGGVISGSLTLGYYTDLKASGDLTVLSPDEIGNSLVRIYCDMELDGETETVELGTFFVDYDEDDLQYGAQEAKLELYSTLLRFTDDVLDGDAWYAAGTSAMGRLSAMVTGEYGKIVYGDGISDVASTASAFFKSGSDKIEYLNYWADLLGCGSVGVDTHGIVTCDTYLAPTMRPVIWSFNPTNCVYQAGATLSHNSGTIPNRIVCACSNDTSGDTSISVHRDLADSSPFSFRNRGRHVTEYHSINDIKGDTASEKTAALTSKLDAYFASILSCAETYTITHTYVPVLPGQCVRLRYVDHRADDGADVVDIDSICLVQSMDVGLSPGLPTKTVLHKLYDLEVV